MAKYTIEEIKQYQEMGILTEDEAAMLIDAITDCESNNCSPEEATVSPNDRMDICIKDTAHWYERYIKEYREMCWNSEDCEEDCDCCDEFRDALIDDIGVNDRVWPYDYPTQELYATACAFADEADEIVSDEDVQWWCGDPGYFRGISSPAVDPRDFTTRKEYLDAVYRQLFAEAVSRHPEIPFTEVWYHVFVDCLNESESLFCAEKSILEILDDDCYNDSHLGKEIVVGFPSEQEHEIRYSTWNKNFSDRLHYNRWGYRKKSTSSYQKEQYDTHQFRSDLLYHYPELSLLVIRAAVKECSSYDLAEPYGIRKVSLVNVHEKETSKTEESIFEYLPEIVINSLFLRDLYDFDVEECVQNGLTGLVKAMKNGLWYQNSRFYDREDYLKWEIRVNMIQYSMELTHYFGFCINRKTAKVIESIIYGKKEVKNISIYDLCDDYRVTNHERYILDKVESFFKEETSGSFGAVPEQEVNTSVYIASQDELASDPADSAFRGLLAREMKEILNTLTATEKYVLQMRFGMYDGNTYTLEEIGQILGVTRERIRQIENKAIRKLRHPSRAKKIKDFYC